jgi:hypothetical protein
MADMLRGNRPRAFCLMFLQVAHGALHIYVLSDRDFGADLKESRGAGLQVSGVLPFESAIKIATLRAIHNSLIFRDERAASPNSQWLSQGRTTF